MSESVPSKDRRRGSSGWWRAILLVAIAVFVLALGKLVTESPFFSPPAMAVPSSGIRKSSDPVAASSVIQVTTKGEQFQLWIWEEDCFHWLGTFKNYDDVQEYATILKLSRGSNILHLEDHLVKQGR